VIALDRLVSLALGELAEEEANVVEEHVLECDACALRLELLVDLGQAVKELVSAGSVLLPATPGLLARLEQEGLVTRTYRMGPGEAVECTVAADDVYVALQLSIPADPGPRIDFIYEAEGMHFRLDDIPFDRARMLVTIAQTARFLRTLPTGSGTVRLVAVDGDGERSLSAYVLNHTATAESTRERP
jgi:hypothetical protein